MKNIVVMLILVSCMGFVSSNIQEFGYNDYDGPILTQDPSTFDNNTASVNDSTLWDGNAWSDTRWLNIDGSNANQNIDIGPYELFAEYLIGNSIVYSPIFYSVSSYGNLNNSATMKITSANNEINRHGFFTIQFKSLTYYIDLSPEKNYFGVNSTETISLGQVGKEWNWLYVDDANITNSLIATTGVFSGNISANNLVGNNTGDQDLSPYWKSDGTSTATGDWNLGVYDLRANEINMNNLRIFNFSGNSFLKTSAGGLYLDAKTLFVFREDGVDELLLEGGNFYPFTDNSNYLGVSYRRWTNIYSYAGDFNNAYIDSTGLGVFKNRTVWLGDIAPVGTPAFSVRFLNDKTQIYSINSGVAWKDTEYLSRNHLFYNSDTLSATLNSTGLDIVNQITVDDYGKLYSATPSSYPASVMENTASGLITANMLKTSPSLLSILFLDAPTGIDNAITFTSNTGGTDHATFGWDEGTNQFTWNSGGKVILSANRWMELDGTGLKVWGDTQVNETLTALDGNFTNDLNVDGNFTGNQIYGEMYYHNYTGIELDFAVTETYYNLFATSNGEYNNGFITAGGYNQTSNLTAQVEGVYDISFGAEGSGQNNHEYHLSLFVNGTEIEKCEVEHKLSAGGDITPMRSRCFYRLYIGDVVDVRIADYTGTGSGMYHGMNLNLVRIGN